MLNKIKKRIKKTIKAVNFVVMMIMLKTSAYASGVSEGSITSGNNQLIDFAFLLVGLLFGSIAAFQFLQAFLAYVQSGSEGGSGQASGKIGTHITYGLVASAAATLVFTMVKPAVKSMIGIG